MIGALLLFAALAGECSDPPDVPKISLYHRSQNVELVAVDRARPMIARYAFAFREQGKDSLANRALRFQAGVAVAAEIRDRLEKSNAELAAMATLTVRTGVRSLRIEGSVPIDGLRSVIETGLSVLGAAKIDANRTKAAVDRALAEERRGDDRRLLERAVIRLLSRDTVRPAPIDRESIEGWIAAHRTKLVVGVVGPVEDSDLEELSKMIDRYASSTPKPKGEPPSPLAAAKATPRHPRVILVDRPGATRVEAALVRKIEPKESPTDRAAVEVLVEALGGANGRLPQLLEVPSNGIEDVYGAIGPSRYGEAAIIAFDAAPAQAASAIREAFEAVKEVRREPWSSDAALAAKNGLLARSRLEMSTAAGVLSAIVDARLVDRPVDDGWKRLRAVEEIDHVALMRATDAVLGDQGWQVVVVAEATPALMSALTGPSLVEAVEVWAYDDVSELIP
jgi:hypothetical protein